MAVAVCQAGTPRRGSEFGRAVAVDAAGQYFVVGTLLGDSSDVAGSGSAYVFYRSTDAYGVDTYYQTPGVLQADNRGVCVCVCLCMCLVCVFIYVVGVCMCARMRSRVRPRPPCGGERHAC